MTTATQIKIDIITGTIDRWCQMDGIYQSHSGLTCDATRHLRRANAAWSAVLMVIGQASNEAILAASKSHPVVWDAVYQIRNSRRA